MTEQPWYALTVRPPFEMLALEGVEGVLVCESSNNDVAVSAPLLKRFLSLSIDQGLIETA